MSGAGAINQSNFKMPGCGAHSVAGKLQREVDDEGCVDAIFVTDQSDHFLMTKAGETTVKDGCGYGVPPITSLNDKIEL